MSEHGWCSLRIRFDQRELELLRGAERLRGTAMAQAARPELLRKALKLAKAGQKIVRGVPGGAVSLEEAEVELLLEALRFAAGEVQWAARRDDDREVARREAVLSAFPEFVEKGAWRAFGVARELEALAARLQSALSV